MKNKLLISGILLILFCMLYANAKDIITTINLDADDIAVDDSSNKIYAVKSSSSQIQVIDGVSNTLLNNISSSSLSPVLAVNSKTGLIYVKKQTMSSFTFADTPGIYVLDGKTGLDTGTFIPIEGSVDDIEIDSSSNKIYVIGVLLKEGKIRLIDGDTNMIIDTLSIPNNANQLSEIAICSKDRAVAIDGPSGTVHILKVDSMNKLSVEGTVTVDNKEAGNSVIACNSTTNKAYTAGTNTNDDTVHVINVSTQMLIESVPIDVIAFSTGGNSISDIAVDSKKNKIYIAQNDNGGDSVVVLDGNSNQFDENTVFSSSVSFSALKVNSDTGNVYVLDGNKNTLTVIEGSSNPSIGNNSSSTSSSTSGGPSSSSTSSSTSSSSTSSSGGQASVSDVEDEADAFLQVLDLFLQLKEKLDSQSKITKVNKINRKLKAILPQLKKLEKKVNQLLELETVFLGNPVSEDIKLCSAVFKAGVKIAEDTIGKIESLSCSAGISTCIAEDKVDEIISAGEGILSKMENASGDESGNGLPDICDYVAVMKGIKGK